VDSSLNEIVRAERAKLETHDFSVERARFLEFATHQNKRTRPRMHWVGVALGLALTVSLIAVYAVLGSRDLTFAVAGTKGETGAWLAGSQSTLLAVDFSDGSQLRLDHDARARVLEVDPAGAHLMLERGRLEVRVVHRASGTNWQVDAGPFAVKVVGTRFDVSWDPIHERFLLELREGAVQLSGPKVARGCTVRSGEQVQISLSDGTVSGSCVAVGRAAHASPTARAAATASASAAPEKETPAPSKQEGWRSFAARGEHPTAWLLVESEGFERVQARSNPTDLMLLANLARFSRAAARATATLRALRERYPTSAEAAEAAFLLGLVAADQQNSPRAAVAWFHTYLAERPNGALAREAWGRVLDCQVRVGDHAEVQRTALIYLQRYPDGPFHALAERALSAAELAPAKEAGALPSPSPPHAPPRGR
jgi:TolA-binding protein